MNVLAIKTDKPDAEVVLLVNEQVVDKLSWHADRQLSETIHIKIEELLRRNKQNLKMLDGVIVFEGPGSFTGLRIGITVANALAYSLNIQIIGSRGDKWLEVSSKKWPEDNQPKFITPLYGAEPHITQPKN